MFVTQYKADELFPSEVHINQNPGGEDFGLQKWVNRDENVKNTDIVAWPCFGVTHISRPEDWPIMPVEILRVHLKPSAFFDVSLSAKERNGLDRADPAAQSRSRRPGQGRCQVSTGNRSVQRAQSQWSYQWCERPFKYCQWGERSEWSCRWRRTCASR